MNIRSIIMSVLMCLSFMSNAQNTCLTELVNRFTVGNKYWSRYFQNRDIRDIDTARMYMTDVYVLNKSLEYNKIQIDSAFADNLLCEMHVISYELGLRQLSDSIKSRMTGKCMDSETESEFAEIWSNKQKEFDDALVRYSDKWCKSMSEMVGSFKDIKSVSPAFHNSLLTYITEIYNSLDNNSKYDELKRVCLDAVVDLAVKLYRKDLVLFYVDKAIDMSVNETEKTKYVLIKAKLFEEQGNAAQCVETLLSYSIDIKNNSHAEAMLYRNMGRQLFREGKYSKSIKFYNMSLAIEQNPIAQQYMTEALLMK